MVRKEKHTSGVGLFVGLLEGETDGLLDGDRVGLVDGCLCCLIHNSVRYYYSKEYKKLGDNNRLTRRVGFKVGLFEG